MKGIIVIVTSPDGHVQGSYADFEQLKPGGFGIQEVQEHRARARVWGEIFYAHCSNSVAKAIGANEFTVKEVANRLLGQGWKETVRELSIGEDEEEQP